MYEISNEIRRNILKEMKDVLSERDYDYSTFALEKIIDTWIERKADLFDILSKHPNWDAERLMIKFDSDFSREIEICVARDFLYWLNNNTNLGNIRMQHPRALYDWGTWRLFDILECDFTRNTYLQDDECTVERIEAINSLSEDFRFRTGMKVTKVMRKICEHFGWDKIMGVETLWDGTRREYNAFERAYAKYCDAVCPIKVKRHTCISLNPIDFLLMSHGNSWRSCHYIDWQSDSPGEYSSGTISYMLDEHSFVFYTVDAEFVGEYIEKEPKIQRQMFGYYNNRLLQSRLYPQSNDCGSRDTYTDIRNIVQKVIADCCDKPNLWVKRSVKNVWKGNGATCYADWSCFGELCSVSVFKDCAERTDLGYIIMGAEPICINCGNHHGCEDNIDCCSSGEVCECCGRHISSDDVHWVGDYPYCDDCVTWCECCDEYEVSENCTWIESESIYVCESCLENYFERCEHCGEWFRREDMRYVESSDRCVCDDCLDEYYTTCEDCGEYFLTDETYELDGRNYCEVCYNDKLEEMEEDEEEAV